MPYAPWWRAAASTLSWLVLPLIAGATLLERSPLDDRLPVAALARTTLVCVPAQASPAEQQAAELIAAQLRAAGGPEQNLLTAEALNDDPLAAGTHHLIAVGLWTDNVVLRKCWGHWSMTAAQRAVIARERAQARQGHPADVLLPEEPQPDWRWTGDLQVFGMGQFTGSVGYLEPGRNFYSLQLIPNGLAGKPEELGKTDQFFVLKVTGSDAAGVLRAAQALVKHGLLHGVLPGDGVAVPREWSPAALGSEQCLTAPPAWAPAQDVPGEQPLRYLGWLQGYSLQYAGLLEAGGAAPRRVWRLKYATPEGFKAYQSFLTPRASGNEVLIAEMADAGAAQQSVKGLQAALGGTWEPYTVHGWQGGRNAEGQTLLAQGKYVLAESLPPGYDLALLQTLALPE